MELALAVVAVGFIILFVAAFSPKAMGGFVLLAGAVTAALHWLATLVR